MAPLRRRLCVAVGFGETRPSPGLLARNRWRRLSSLSFSAALRVTRGADIPTSAHNGDRYGSRHRRSHVRQRRSHGADDAFHFCSFMCCELATRICRAVIDGHAPVPVHAVGLGVRLELLRPIAMRAIRHRVECTGGANRCAAPARRAESCTGAPPLSRDNRP